MRSLLLIAGLLAAPALALVPRNQAVQGSEVINSNIIWNLVTASPTEKDSNSENGYGDPFRRNGTWPDIGVWNRRPEAIKNAPARVRAVAVRRGPTAATTTYQLVNADRPSERLAYVDSSDTGTMPVNGLSAFIFVDGSKRGYATNRWTITTDKFGRLVLGEGQRSDPVHGTAWAELGPNWCYVDVGDCPDTEFCNHSYCDGLSYKLCGLEDACFGRPTRVQLVQAKNPMTGKGQVWAGPDA